MSKELNLGLKGLVLRLYEDTDLKYTKFVLNPFTRFLQPSPSDPSYSNSLLSGHVSLSPETSSLSQIINLPLVYSSTLPWSLGEGSPYDLILKIPLKPCISRLLESRRLINPVTPTSVFNIRIQLIQEISPRSLTDHSHLMS